jgi:hypothetical protein
VHNLRQIVLYNLIIIIIPSSHSINAIGPAPHRSGNNREHCSAMLVIIAHIPSLNKILSNTPGNHSTPPLTTPHIIRHMYNLSKCWYVLPAAADRLR